LGIKDFVVKRAGCRARLPVHKLVMVLGQTVLHLLEQISLNDGIMLAGIRFILVGYFAQVDTIAQQIREAAWAVKISTSFLPASRCPLFGSDVVLCPSSDNLRHMSA
jgi:hypothetical protein